MSRLTVIKNSLFSLFFPPVCAACGHYLEDEKEGVLCEACMLSLPRTEQAAIRENSTEMSLWGEARSRAAAKKVMHLERAAAFLFFEKDHPIRRVIHVMKYADRPEIGAALGRQAAIEMQYADFFDEIDVIIPIPLHKKRLRSRGYNQSEYIARGLSAITGIPVDTTHVTRERNTPKQALQGGEGRKTNVQNAFGVNHPEQLYHKHILLVDDLLTTGETMKACMKAMRTIRGAKISVFALCKAR